MKVFPLIRGLDGCIWGPKVLVSIQTMYILLAWEVEMNILNKYRIYYPSTSFNFRRGNVQKDAPLYSGMTVLSGVLVGA